MILRNNGRLKNLQRQEKVGLRAVDVQMGPRTQVSPDQSTINNGTQIAKRTFYLIDDDREMIKYMLDVLRNTPGAQLFGAQQWNVAHTARPHVHTFETHSAYSMTTR
jgi:hypothetical protein